jgi:radical SAM protein with 4Fe4S-binding SPASM domain
MRRLLGGELNQLAYNFQTLGARGAPQVFQIELTNHCPMTCTMCPRTHAMTRPLGHMDEALFRRIIDDIASYSEGIFLHHFGDSLVHPQLAACIRYAHDRGVKTYLSANPALLTPKRAGELIDSGLHELVLSLDGFSSETSAAIRGPAARDVAAAERNILMFLQMRKERNTKTPRLILQIVKQKQNQHEIEAWLNKWSAMKDIDRIKVKSYVTWDGQNEYINSLRITPEPDTRDIVCDKPWTSVTVLWDGRVVPCCFDYDGLNVLGDLRTESLRSIWNGERMRQFRQAHRSGDLSGVKLCERCTDREGYPVSTWKYPFNRLMGRQTPLGNEEPSP